MGIPRPDVKEDEAEKETYPGQGREMQGRVYDRLARLTNLETLWLQGDARYIDIMVVWRCHWRVGCID